MAEPSVRAELVAMLSPAWDPMHTIGEWAAAAVLANPDVVLRALGFELQPRVCLDLYDEAWVPATTSELPTSPKLGVE